MKTVMVLIAGMFIVALSASLALANPALLPKHEGYPMKNDGSPVTGQPTANDPGQASLNGEKAVLQGAAANQQHVEQHLMDQNNARIAEKAGAGRLPKVQGPQIMIEPPVKSATKIGADRVIQ
jgi:hypothetical protein